MGRLSGGSGGKAGGGASKARGALGSGKDAVFTKTRKLVTRNDKLIRLRAALFDDDEGGFGAERDVTKWLARPFLDFRRNGVEVTIEFSHGEALIGKDLDDLIQLAAIFAEEAEHDAGREWNEEDKQEHLVEDAARFLVARDSTGTIVAFLHFRFTLHGEMADEMEGQCCLFVYDLHITPSLQRRGLGRHLMCMAELIARKANMFSMIMPIPRTELADSARTFLTNKLRGWVCDMDALAEAAPRTAKAIAEDNSLEVYAKQLEETPSIQREEEVGDVPIAEKICDVSTGKVQSAPGVTEEPASEIKRWDADITEDNDDWVKLPSEKSAPSKNRKSGKHSRSKKSRKKHAVVVDSPITDSQ